MPTRKRYRLRLIAGLTIGGLCLIGVLWAARDRLAGAGLAFSPNASATPVPTETSTKTASPTPTEPPIVTYTVKAGDSLFSVAETFDRIPRLGIQCIQELTGCDENALIAFAIRPVGYPAIAKLVVQKAGR